MKRISPKAKLFIDNALSVAANCTEHIYGEGCIVAILPLDDKIDRLPLTYQHGVFKRSQVHKYAFCAIEESLRLKDSKVYRSSLCCDPRKFQFGGGVRLGDFIVVTKGWRNARAEEGISAVIAAYLQSEKKHGNEHPEKKGFFLDAQWAVEKFMDDMGIDYETEGENMHDYKRYLLQV